MQKHSDKKVNMFCLITNSTVGAAGGKGKH